MLLLTVVIPQMMAVNSNPLIITGDKTPDRT